MSLEKAEMRRWLHGQMDIQPDNVVVDLGCGEGDDTRLLAENHPLATFVGIDNSEEWVAKAKLNALQQNVRFICADASKPLPFEDASVDHVYSVNVIECIPDKTAFLQECARILKPNGSILMAHFDWDTQTFDGEDRALVRKIIQAFNDWQQAWMETIDPWAGRRLLRYFAEEGSFKGDVKAHTLVSSSFEEGSYGRVQAESFEALVRRNLVAAEEFTTFMDFLHKSAAEDAFFYSITLFAFVGQKRR